MEVDKKISLRQQGLEDEDASQGSRDVNDGDLTRTPRHER